MAWRRISLAIAILAAWLALRGAPTPIDPRPGVATDLPTRAADADADAAEPAPRTLPELQARLERLIAREHIAGAGVALVDRRGPIWVGGVGVRDRASGAPMTADTAFRVGSLSKGVIALAVMRLADQGKLDVDRPLRELLPGVVDNPWEATAPVTLAQCLEHTAGLDDLRFNEVFTDDEHLPVAATLALNPRSRRVRWPPGTRHAYSNVGYTIAARAIEVAAGEPFDAYVRREILAPLGIADADFARTGTLGARLATGYMDADDPVEFRPFAHRPAASLLMSAADLAKLVHFWITRGAGYPPIVSAAGLARIERSGTLPYPHLDAEYGFGNYGDVTHPVISRGHDGGMPGFHASFRYVPTRGVGYVLLLNAGYSFRGYLALRSLLYDYLVRDHADAPPVAVAAPTPPGARYYEFAAPRSALFAFVDRVTTGWHVDDHGDHLDVAERHGRFALVRAPDGAYRQPGDCGTSVLFLARPDGTELVVGGFGYGEGATGWIADVRFVAIAIALALLHVAPLWSVVVLLAAALRGPLGRRGIPIALALGPALAGLCAYAVPRLLDAAFFTGVIGRRHPLTIALCAVTLVFAASSFLALALTIRVCLRPDRPSRAALVLPMLFGLVFTALALWFGAHGVIGLRTWAW